MKRDKIRIYILEIFFITILFFALFVSNMTSRINLAVFTAIYMVITCMLVKRQNQYSIYKNQVTILMVAFAIIYLSVFYLMGLYFGFYKATVTFSKWSLIRYIIPTIIIIISSEIIRSIFIAQEDKQSKMLVLISMVIIDIILYAGIYDISTLKGLLAIIGFIIFASIACNLLYNYISIRFGNKPIILYRIITVLYAYVIPIIPDIYTFFRSFLRILYPYIIYLILEYMYNRKEPEIKKEKKSKTFLFTMLLIIFLTILIMLVSCQFKYGLLVIGSGSMTGTIDKGDVILYESYDNQKITEGQVIVFNHDDIQLVHRVVSVKNVNGEKRYFTKGDINEETDDGYITEEQIIGIYKFRIKYIGYPTIWVRDIF